MGDIAVGRSYLTEQHVGGGKAADRTINLNDWLKGTTPGGASRSGAKNLGASFPSDFKITADQAAQLDSLIDQGYKIQGQADLGTRISYALNWWGS